MIGKIFKVIINICLFALIAIGILVIFSFVPIKGNYKLFTVQSGSMEPTIKTGSLIFVKPLSDYSIGDIITRRTLDPKVTVTHRIQERTEQNGTIIFKTKGDANQAEDSEFVDRESVVGKVLLWIPYLGYPVGFARTSQGIILIIVIPAVIIIYDEINKIKKEIVALKNKKKEEKENV
jgi:signal peptidase I